MRFIIYILLILISFLLQTTLFEHIIITDVKPNILLILVVSFAFMRGEIEGAIIGFCSGFLVDSFFGSILGINSFIYLILGFLCGKIFNKFYKDSVSIPFFLTLFFSLLYGILFFFFNVFLRGAPNILPFLNSIIVPEALYTSILSYFVYKLFFLINKLLEKSDRKKKNLFKK